MTLAPRCLLVVLVVAIAGPASDASANSITIRTGVNGALTVLGENVSDPFWMISVDGGGSFTSAEVINSEVLCCDMDTVGAQAAWISDPSVTDGSAATGWTAEDGAIATRQFDLTGFNLVDVVLSGAWRVADVRQGIYLNGNLIDVATADNQFGFTEDQFFYIAFGSGYFLPGVNTLRLQGTTVNQQWDGFWLDATVNDENPPPVPEPGTLILIGLGLAGYLPALRRRVRR
jgi:hypothetical protein